MLKKTYKIKLFTRARKDNNRDKIFSEPFYMIKSVLTFVSSVHEFVLVDFLSQNKVQISHIVKTWQNCLIKNFLTKTNKFIFFSYFFEFLSCF